MKLDIIKKTLTAGVIAGAMFATSAMAVPIGGYEGTINSGDTVFGNVSEATGDFWSFSANAGDYIVLTGHRLDAALDMAFDLYFGTGADTGDLAYIDTGDDEIPELPGYEGPFADPQVEGFLSATGDYTVYVWSFLSGELTDGAYQLQLTIRPGDIPAPAGLGLLGLGLVGLGLARRRK